MTPQLRREIIQRLRAAGFCLFPCVGKVPARKGVNWRETTLDQYTDGELADRNFGVALKVDQLVVDVDPRSFPEGDNPLKRLIAVVGDEAFRKSFRVQTGGGGLHIYMTVQVPEGMEIADSKDYPGINFKHYGGFVVGPGSIHPDTKKPYEIAGGDPTKLVEAPEALLDIVLRPVVNTFSTAGTGSFKDDDATRERFNAYLATASPSIQGQGGDANAFKVAARGRDFALPPETTWRMMTEGEWNTKCVPPWSADELHDVVENAYRYARGAVGNAHPEADFEQVTVPTSSPKEITMQSRFSPSTPFTPRPPVWPKSLGEAAYHGLAGDFVRLVEPHTEADNAAVLVQFLVAFGNLVGRAPYFTAEADKHRTNLFANMVGDTSKGRKGTSWGQVRAPLSLVDDEWLTNRIQSGLSSGEGLVWAVRDPIETRSPIKERGKTTGYETIESDGGVSDKRLLAIESEFASTLRVLGREGNTLSALVRQSWDSGDLRVLTKNNPAKATGAHISILGHITKDELRRHLDQTESANGFANRFLWICVRRSKQLPDGGQRVDFKPLAEQLRSAAASAKAYGAIDSPNPNGFCFKRDSLARGLWHEVYGALSDGKPGLLGAVISRAEAQVTRLSLVYALLDKSSEIRREHLEAALEVWRYAEDSARYIFGSSLGNPLADEVLSTLQANPTGMTKTVLGTALVGHHRRESLPPALSLLQSQGLIACRREQTGGRAAEVWFATATGEEGAKGVKEPDMVDQATATTGPEISGADSIERSLAELFG